MTFCDACNAPAPSKPYCKLCLHVTVTYGVHPHDAYKLFLAQGEACKICSVKHPRAKMVFVREPSGEIRCITCRRCKLLFNATRDQKLALNFVYALREPLPTLAKVGPMTPPPSPLRPWRPRANASLTQEIATLLQESTSLRAKARKLAQAHNLKEDAALARIRRAIRSKVAQGVHDTPSPETP